MKEIEANPGLWSMVNRMVNKAQKHPEPTATVSVAVNQQQAVQGKDRDDNSYPCTPKAKSYSDSTLYRPALKQKVVGVGSPNNQIDDEPEMNLDDEAFDKISNYIERVRIEAGQKKKGQTVRERGRGRDESPASDEERPDRRFEKPSMEEAILQAERSRAAVLTPKGKKVPERPVLDVASIDNAYFQATSHVDKTLRDKISNGEYVELEKLLPKRRTGRVNEEDRIDIVNKDGHSFLVQTSATDKANKIFGIKKWDEAFRIYTTIFSQHNPTRAAEIVQYANCINSAAASFQWENVVYYDETFRRQMEEHPERSWAITNSQLWTYSMREHLPPRGRTGRSSETGQTG